MTARCTHVNAAPEAPRLELRFGLSRAIGTVGEHVVRCITLVQEPIQLLAVVNCRVAHRIAPDQLVLGIRIHVVLVAVKALAVLLRPAEVEALKAAGCEQIFNEKASVKSTNGRPELAKLMKALLPGDIVTVTKLDRVARSARDLLNIVHQLQEARCGFVSLGDSWCDTTNEMGRFMLTVMSGVGWSEI